MIHKTINFVHSMCTYRQCSDMFPVPVIRGEIPPNDTSRTQKDKNTDFSYASGKNTKIVVHMMTCVRKEIRIPSKRSYANILRAQRENTAPGVPRSTEYDFFAYLFNLLRY